MTKKIHRQVSNLLKPIVLGLCMYGVSQTTLGQVVKVERLPRNDNVQKQSTWRPAFRCANSLRMPSPTGPLYVIDGVIIPWDSVKHADKDPLADIDPATIESIEVLEDADATAIFGVRGECGVVLVTTKKRKKR